MDALAFPPARPYLCQSSLPYKSIQDSLLRETNWPKALEQLMIIINDKNPGHQVRINWLSQTDPVGTFEAVILLKHIFGFADTYDKILKKVRVELELRRNEGATRMATLNAAALDIENNAVNRPKS